MLKVTVNINNKFKLADLHVVRTTPKYPKQEEVCSYDFYIDKIKVDKIMFPYGDGIELSIEMLKKYNENKKKYDLIVLADKISRK